MPLLKIYAFIMQEKFLEKIIKLVSDSKNRLILAKNKGTTMYFPIRPEKILFIGIPDLPCANPRFLTELFPEVLG
jgi:hypothetical protein